MAERLRARAREWLRVGAHQPLLFLLVLLAGGLGGLAYSSGPLHHSKNWRLEYLDTQLAGQNQRVRDLETALAQSALQPDNSLAPAQEVALREELAQTVTQRDQQADRAATAEAGMTKAKQTSDRWRAQFRKAETELSSELARTAELGLERDSLLARLSAVGSHSAPPPAAVDPDSEALAEGLELMVGESWSSPDGQVSFDVVDVDQQIASLRGSWQASAAGPERVAAGHQLTERRGETVYRIFVTAVSPYRSVTIRATSGPR